jgi:nucleotidyltransferase substrate binding protein (TIGR01987 family)
MKDQDIRWVQRLFNFKKAFNEFEEAVNHSNTQKLSKLEKQGLIQSFEYTHELAWKTLKDYFIDQGNSLITGSKDATREAFKNNLINNGEIWMKMISDRNLTSHTYNLQTADQIVSNILNDYYTSIKKLIETLDELKK